MEIFGISYELFGISYETLGRKANNQNYSFFKKS